MKSFISALFLFVTSLVMAQNIKGKVINENKEPLDYATVDLIQNGKTIQEVFTDDKGFFQFENIPTGDYTLHITFFGTGELDRAINVVKTDVSVGELVLDMSKPAASNSTDAAIITNKEVVVVATPKTVEYKLDKKVYNVSDDKTLVGSTSLDALNNAPSVNVDVDGSISLRGDSNIKILIDGKASNIVSSDNTNFLKSLSADAIQKIEVITAPSARYDADGNAGIINIVLKKGKKAGVNGSVSLSGGYPDLAGIAASINYKTEKYNTYLNVGADYKDSPGNGYVFNHYFKTDSISEVNRELQREKKSFFVNTGLDWYINPKHTLGFNVKYSPETGTNTTDVFYEDYAATSPSNRISTTRNESQDQPETSFNAGIDYVYDINDKGQKLSISSLFGLKDSEAESNITQTQLSSITYDRYNTDQKNRMYALQADYILPFGKNKQLELGAKYEYNDLKNSYITYYYDDVTNSFEINPTYTNDFDYTQALNAFYAQFGDKIGNWSYLLGLRTEQTYIDLKNVTIESVFYDSYKKNDFALFPTAHINYEIGNSSIQFGYSRRVMRPQTRMLNPFVGLSDNRNMFRGNPNLDAMYTDALELGYVFSTKKITVSPSVYYNYTSDPIQFFTESVLENGTQVIYSYPVNMDSEQRYGAELGINYKPLSWLSLNTDFNYYKFHSKGLVTGMNGITTDLSTDSDGYFARFGVNTKLPKDFSFQVKGNYKGKGNGVQTTTVAMWFVNASLSKELLQKKATLTFSVQDLFNTQKRGRTSTTETYYSDAEMQMRERQWVVNLTYRFGSSGKKDKQKEKARPESSGQDDMGGF